MKNLWNKNQKNPTLIWPPLFWYYIFWNSHWNRPSQHYSERKSISFFEKSLTNCSRKCEHNGVKGSPLTFLSFLRITIALSYVINSGRSRRNGTLITDKQCCCIMEFQISLIVVSSIDLEAGIVSMHIDGTLTGQNFCMRR